MSPYFKSSTNSPQIACNSLLNGIIVEQQQQHLFSFLPWGIAPPSCPNNHKPLHPAPPARKINAKPCLL